MAVLLPIFRVDDALELERPRTRGDCTHARPCPFVACRHSLVPEALERQPGLEPDEVDPARSCVLDVVDLEGDLALADVGELLGLTVERVRAAEHSGFTKIAKRSPLAEHADPGFRRARAVRSLPSVRADERDPDDRDDAAPDVRPASFFGESDAAACSAVWGMLERRGAIDAIRRAGELLAAMREDEDARRARLQEQAPIARLPAKIHGVAAGPVDAPPRSAAVAAREAGVSARQAKTAMRVANVPAPVFETELASGDPDPYASSAIDPYGGGAIDPYAAPALLDTNGDHS